MFLYATMTDKELQKEYRYRGLGNKDYPKRFDLIEDLIEYDKKNPDKYMKTDDEESALDELYFEGWNDDNRDWAKNILAEMTDEIYAGLEGIGENTSGGFGGGSVSLEGVEIKGSKVSVTYYSQNDPRWADKPIIDSYPQYTISSSGCGFASMASSRSIGVMIMPVIFSFLLEHIQSHLPRQ